VISIRVALASAGAILVFACGWYARGKETQIVDRPVTKIVTQVVEHTNTVVQQVDHVVTKTVVVKVTEPGKPATETTTTTTTADDTVHTQKATQAATTTTTTTPRVGSDVAQRNYSVGVQWAPDWRDRTWVPSVFEVGYRVWEPLWVTGGYDVKNKQALVGLRVEF